MVYNVVMNNFEDNIERTPTIGDARQHIEAVRSEIMSMGANDSENESLDQVIVKLEDGDITSTEAMQQADAIRDSKQSYH